MTHKSIAPHLPPPTCNVEQHHRLQRLKVLAVATVFGLMAGLSGASMLVGWIWPSLGDGDVWIVSRARSSVNRQQLQDKVSAATQDTIFTLYARSSALTEKDVFLFGAPLGRGVGIVSEGWIVTMLPVATRASDVLAVGRNGLVYAVTDIVSDKSTGFSYAHITRLTDGKPSTLQEQIHTVALADTPTTLADVVVATADMWMATSLTDTLSPLSTEPHSLGAPVFGYRAADSLPSGSIVFDTDGKLMGFVNKNMIVPLATSAQTLPTILAGQTPTRSGLGVWGWYSEERALIVNGQRTPGFVVAKVDTKTTVFKKGDILLTVNGEPFTIQAWRNIGTPTAVRVTVLRAGRTVELNVPRVAE